MKKTKLVRIISIILVMTMITACGSKGNENDIETVKEKKFESKTEKEINLQKVNTTSATEKISLVDSKYTKFWKAIDNNYIDLEYNIIKVEKGNIRLLCKVNKEYAQKWLDELDKTYQVLKDRVDKELKGKLETQYEAFNEYYDLSEKVYTYILDVDDEYSGKVDGLYKVRQYYVLADEIREYTILLKEYIYLIDGKVEFYYGQDIKDKVKNKKQDNTYTNNETEFEFKIIVDNRFKDIIKDRYNKKLDCSIKKLKLKKAQAKTKKHYEYWKHESDNAFEAVKNELKGEHKDIIKDQRKSYNKYVTATTKVHNTILLDSKKYKKTYKKDVTVDNNLYKANKNIQYTVLLLEYYYAITDKFDF